MLELRIIKGDATSPQAKGPKIVAHVCNDIGGWGKERIEPLVVAALCARDIPTTVYDFD